MFHYINIEKCSNLDKAFGKIPEGTTVLHLKLCKLDCQKKQSLINSFSNIPASVEKLELIWDEFCEQPGADLAQILKATPKSVSAIKLFGNKLGAKRNGFLCIRMGMALVPVFRSVPINVVELNLGSNQLYKKTGAELASAFQALGENVKKLDLSQNEFNLLSLNSLKKLAGKLPHVETLTLDVKQIRQMTEPQVEAFREIFPKIKNAEQITVTNADEHSFVTGRMGLVTSFEKRHQSEFFNKNVNLHRDTALDARYKT